MDAQKESAFVTFGSALGRWILGLLFGFTFAVTATQPYIQCNIFSHKAAQISHQKGNKNTSTKVAKRENAHNNGLPGNAAGTEKSPRAQAAHKLPELPLDRWKDFSPERTTSPMTIIHDCDFTKHEVHCTVTTKNEE